MYQWSELGYDLTGDGTRPEMRLGASSWVWQRYGLSVAGKRYVHGVTVHGDSSVTIDLNRACTAFDALVGVDDLTAGLVPRQATSAPSRRSALDGRTLPAGALGRVSFTVYADGVRLWHSGTIAGGDPAVPVHVSLTGRRTVRLVATPGSAFDAVTLADWAESGFTCG